jgi:hypothetical protein
MVAFVSSSPGTERGPRREAARWRGPSGALRSRRPSTMLRMVPLPVLARI